MRVTLTVQWIHLMNNLKSLIFFIFISFVLFSFSICSLSNEKKIIMKQNVKKKIFKINVHHIS